MERKSSNYLAVLAAANGEGGGLFYHQFADCAFRSAGKDRGGRHALQCMGAAGAVSIRAAAEICTA